MRTWMYLSAALALGLAAACACPPPASAPSPSTVVPAERGEPAEPVEPAEPAKPADWQSAQGQPCGDGGACPAPLACKSYYGVAGPSGPQFTSCEVSCDGKSACPDGQACVAIADGPGQVCRPAPAPKAADWKAAQGQPCGEGGACPAPLSCKTYYGVAGPSGPQFSSCEVACGTKGARCPAGQGCVTISDGPGAVCRATP